MKKFEDPDLAAMAGKRSSRAGVPNKVTTDVRKAFRMLIESNLDRLQMDLDALKPIDRLRIILELSKFVIPQLQSVSLSDLRENEMQGFAAITIRLRGNNGEGNDNNNEMNINEINDEREGDNDNSSNI